MITPDETEDKFRQYEVLLKKWQTAVNLVSPNTVSDIRERHILDSARLKPLIPVHAKTLYDFGSGAGFPGMVLAMVLPHLEVHLIESDQKKCSFLSTISRETRTPVTIHNRRIESFVPAPAVDVITARALAPLPVLLGYILPFAEANRSLTILLLKGENVYSEIKDATKDYDFSFDLFPGYEESQGLVLRLSGLSKKSA